MDLNRDGMAGIISICMYTHGGINISNIKTHVFLLILVIVIFSAFAVSFWIIDSGRGERHTYAYTLSIEANNSDGEYFLTVPIPEGWKSFENDVKTVQGTVEYNKSTIDGHPVLNISGKGNITISFLKESHEEELISFDWARNINSTSDECTAKVYVELMDNNTLKIDVRYLYEGYYPDMRPPGVGEDYYIRGTVDKSGWHYLEMGGSIS